MPNSLALTGSWPRRRKKCDPKTWVDQARQPGKAVDPIPSSMGVFDLGGGSGPPRLHTGGAKNIWVKKNHHAREND